MRKNASILIFVLFMMIVVSLYAILIAIFVKNIINRSGIFHRFEKTYYLAYAGIELELTKTKYHQR
jgi:phage-related holin